MKLSRTLALATDQCAELTYAGAMDFKDGIDKQEEYLWDANGNMTRDRNKDIYEICYNVLNLPERIRYYDGHEVQYTYAADRHMHTGLEQLNFGGLGWYDNHARWYDPVSMRFTSPDPLAEKYFHITPFANCANNPMNCIDINGDSTAVLGYSNGEHIALLIQHSDKKWYYYSFNGTGFYILSSGSIGGLPVHNLGNGPFNSVAAFLDSYYNREGTYAERSSGIVNGYGYDEAAVYPSNEEQDKLVRAKFIGVVASGYNPITNNCGTAVKVAVESIGIDTSTIGRNFFSVFAGFHLPMKQDTLLPSSIYKAIKNNKNITIIKK